jgi:hypothetical protein
VLLVVVMVVLLVVVMVVDANGLGGEVSNLDLGLQRTPCCRYTTPDLVLDHTRRTHTRRVPM